MHFGKLENTSLAIQYLEFFNTSKGRRFLVFGHKSAARIYPTFSGPEEQILIPNVRLFVVLEDKRRLISRCTFPQKIN
jgi:hypothetical protein